MRLQTLLFFALAAGAFAQGDQPLKEADLLKQIDLFGASAQSGSSASPAQSSTRKASKPTKDADAEEATPTKGPTEITSTKEAAFDNKTRRAVFIGTVRVKDPQFTLTADKLTAILRDNDAAKAAGAASPAGSPARTKNGAPGASGLERAIAEGNVVIVQEKPGEDGGPAKRYVGKAERAEFEAATGEMTLTGWPQIQQGINTQIATEASTVMILNRDGRMKTEGGSKTVIQEKADE